VTARKLVKAARCVVCAHPERARIEFGKVSGASLDSLALTFKVSRDAIWRHCNNHVTDAARVDYLAAIPMKDLAEKAAAEGVSVLEYFSIIRGVLMTQFQLAHSINDRVAVSTLAGRLNEVLRSIGSISGELGGMAAHSINITNNVNVLNSPIYATLQANLLTALAPYPQARAAVVQALRQIDQQHAPPMTIEHSPVDEFATVRVALDVPSIQNQSVIS
jgi:hypothetical protein